jgi:hypothetical protein
MRIKPTTVGLGMLVVTLAAAGAFAGAIPANAAAVNHPHSVITGAPARASAMAPRKLIQAAPDSGRYPAVENGFTIWLTDAPNPNMTSVCRWQTVYLTRGTYGWYMIPNPVEADIYLASSNYTWGTCIIPDSGHYIQSSILCPINLPPQYHCVVRTEKQYPSYSGNYRIASVLNWLYL